MSLNNNGNDAFKGKRFIALVRASNDTDGTTSTEAQLNWMHEEGRRLGMQHVADVVLSGVTGSLPGRRKDLAELLRRRAEHRDFDVLLVQRCDRLSRGGAAHLLWFIHEANCVGLVVHFAGDDIPADGSFRNTILSMKADAAQEQAKAIGQRSVQGSMHSVARGFNCVVSRTPFGCDRLYLTGDGRPQFIIRNLGDGRQHKLQHETGAVLDTYGQVGGGNKGHYDKQKDERVQLVPGAPEAVETVRLIFELHYGERKGGKRIADILNERGVRSPTGIEWSQRQVESIYENPVYCGVARGHGSSQGIYYKQGAAQPEQVRLDSETLSNCWTPPRKLRPPSEWVWQKQPGMADFLPADLAAKALPQIESLLLVRWERSQELSRQTRSTNKHKNGDYILTGVLVAKQDGEPLTGVLCGKVGKKVRKYRHRRASRGYRKGSIFNNYIRAAELEEAVLTLVAEVIADAPWLREQVIASLRASQPDAESAERLESLRSQREKLAQRVRFIMRTLSEEHLADVQPELDAIAAQRRDLERQIAELESKSAFAAEDPERIAEDVVSQLAAWSADFRSVSASVKRDLIEAYVERVEVDMATKNAEVSLKLPDWAFEGRLGVRLANSSRSQTSHETPPRLVVRLAVADCRYILRPFEVCYTCRRRAA
jgi:predicted site-specific integrase-resolvase